MLRAKVQMEAHIVCHGPWTPGPGFLPFLHGMHTQETRTLVPCQHPKALLCLSSTQCVCVRVCVTVCVWRVCGVCVRVCACVKQLVTYPDAALEMRPQGRDLMELHSAGRCD